MATVADFQLRFPEFCEDDDDRVQLFLDDAALLMDSPNKWLTFYDVAHLYYAAHFLVSATATEMGDTAPLAPLKRQEVDDVVIESAISPVAPSFDELNSTAYGKRYAFYRRLVTIGIYGV